jgi:hypothetical protein
LAVKVSIFKDFYSDEYLLVQSVFRALKSKIHKTQKGEGGAAELGGRGKDFRSVGISPYFFCKQYLSNRSLMKERKEKKQKKRKKERKS